MTGRAPALTILFVFLGCQNPGDFSADSSWRVTLPIGDPDLADESFEIHSFWEVTASELPVALTALEEQEIVDISDYDWGTRLFGVRVADLPPVSSTGRRFLVRALYIYPATGGFSVYFDGRRLWVSHSCLGKSLAPAKKTALLVVLPSAPDVVYVDASVDE